MENGRRSIGKELAKRIAEKFEVDYRNFVTPQVPSTLGWEYYQ